MTNDADPSQGHETHSPHEPTLSPAEYWEQLYRERGQSWSGNQNAALDREATPLTPARALDLGSGEGGDALWLAGMGWTVTGVDISPTALAFGRARAEDLGLADRITWVEADLSTWQPQEEFDLVSAHFLHSHVELPREQILRRMATAVAPGGTLLVVGHLPNEHMTGSGHAALELPTPGEVLDALDLREPEWAVVTSAIVERIGRMPDGTDAPLLDSVLAVRRAMS